MFQDEPQAEASGQMYRIVRTPKKGNLSGILLSERHIGAPTHYWGGRTIICRKLTCPACKEGNAPRWYGYAPLWSVKSKAIAIVEWTAKAHEPIKNWLTEHGNFLGCQLSLERVGNKANGRLHARICSGDYSKELLPEPADIKAMLLTMWGVTPEQQQEMAAEEALAQKAIEQLESRQKRVGQASNGKHRRTS